MIQQVNLYQDCVKPEAHLSGFNIYTGGTVAAAMMVLLLTAQGLWQQRNIEQQLNEARQQVSAGWEQVNRITASRPKQELDSTLIEKIKHMEMSVNELKQTLQLLDNESFSQANGFSGFFSALSKQSIPEIWLTAIVIDKEKSEITLQGYTLKAEKIAVFLQNLQSEPVFQGRSFAALNVQQSQENPALLAFSVSTQAAAKEKDDNHVQ